MNESANLLNDVGQRFDDIRLRLLSLQSAYEVRKMAFYFNISIF